MAQWIAFDTASAEQLKQMGPNGTVIVRAGTALQAALEDPNDSTVIMPGPDAQSVLMVKFKHRRESQPKYEATGFLGLTDEPVYEDEAPAEEKKGWWKKIF